MTLGDGTVIGPFVQILDSDLHAAGAHGVMPEPEPVRIGRGVIIGAWSMILPGTIIGDGAVVEPHSVVSGAIAAGVTVTGNPATPRVRPGPARPGHDTTDLVCETIQATFGLTTPPEPAINRDAIPAWNSLGALRLLVALTDATGLALPDTELLGATSVDEVTEIVERALVR